MTVATSAERKPGVPSAGKILNQIKKANNAIVKKRTVTRTIAIVQSYRLYN